MQHYFASRAPNLCFWVKPKSIERKMVTSEPIHGLILGSKTPKFDTMGLIFLEKSDIIIGPGLMILVSRLAEKYPPCPRCVGCLHPA